MTQPPQDPWQTTRRPDRPVVPPVVRGRDRHEVSTVHASRPVEPRARPVSQVALVVAAVAAAVALLVGVVVLATASGDPRRTAGTAASPASRAPATASPAGHTVRFEVSSSDGRPVARVEWQVGTDKAIVTKAASGWSHEVTDGRQLGFANLVVWAAAPGQQVTCKLVVDGVPVDDGSSEEKVTCYHAYR